MKDQYAPSSHPWFKFIILWGVLCFTLMSGLVYAVVHFLMKFW